MIRFEIRGDVGVATIDRPERRNALNGELCAQLRDHLVEQSDLRAIVITGAGTAFCAGADLVTRFDGGEGEAVVDTFRPTFEEALDAITDCRVPVIAAVNGPAIGAGMQLAVACDLRIAGPTARFAIPGGKLGVHLSSKNIWRLALLVGQGAARDFLLAGRTVDAADALRLARRRAAQRRRARAMRWPSPTRSQRRRPSPCGGTSGHSTSSRRRRRSRPTRAPRSQRSNAPHSRATTCARAWPRSPRSVLRSSEVASQAQIPRPGWSIAVA